MSTTKSTAAFRAARDLLWQHRTDHAAAVAAFQWPVLDDFNWALDWFDVIAKGNDRPALRIVSDDATRPEQHLVRSFAELSSSSNRVANGLRALGVKRGDRVLLMLGNELAIWECMLAAIKLGAVVIPASTQLTPTDLHDRVARGGLKHVVVNAAYVDRFAGIDTAADGTPLTKVVVGATRDGWHSYDDVVAADDTFVADGVTKASDPLLLYFTSGTTAKPKLVLHTHQSYPVGHLSTMYWVGLQEGDVHLNISSPGWAKHAWSSFFAPWNAGATIVAHEVKRFDAKVTLQLLRDAGITTMCCPPTVWRMLILEQLGDKPSSLRELVSAGEPLNAEVIERVKNAWHLTVRDGYGQTETTLQIGNTPGTDVVAGQMGRPLPGYRVALLDSTGAESSEGEIALSLSPRPTGLMIGYVDDDDRTAAVMAGGWYRTGDEAARGADGRFTYLARGDDLFKSSDYRISPFELESALLEHDAVAEAAVVPSPDPVRLSVPKAFVVVKPGVVANADTARSIFAFLQTRLPPYKRIKRLQFAALPKTISGKIRRVELRALENTLRADTDARGVDEFFYEDFAAGLKG